MSPNSQIRFSDCVFDGNTAGNTAGLVGGTAERIECDACNGGAIFVSSNCTVDITRTLLNKNVALEIGGVYIYTGTTASRSQIQLFFKISPCKVWGGDCMDLF